MPPACPVEHDVNFFSEKQPRVGNQREPPPGKPVASPKDLWQFSLATSVNLHGISPWHQESPLKHYLENI
jgi:hypothetical protein